MRGVVTAVALVALALLLGTGTAQAQTAKLVSNTGQTDDASGAIFTSDHAQSFTTGNHANGYTLTRVDMELASTSTPVPTYTVRIQDSSSSRPGTILGILTQQGTLSGTATLVQFTASGTGIVLDPDTTYWVVIDVTAAPHADTTVAKTSLAAEDSGGAAGWSIADGRLWRMSTAGPWETPP